MTDQPDSSLTQAAQAEPARFFQKVDWFSFGLAFGLALAVYLFTLAPDVTLEYSGIYSASAMYPGASIPPGHPVWEIYGWLFIKLLPFSNIAWRLGVSSAIAGALACGLIALMVSRVGMLAVEHIDRFSEMGEPDQKSLRVVCGLVAGLGFGFDGCFWPKAVVVDTWPLSLLLLTLTICLLTRWFFRPDQRRYLVLTAFVLGLTLCESQALIPAAYGLPFVVAMGHRGLGRDFFLGISLFLWGIVATKSRWEKLGWSPYASTWHILTAVAALAALMWIVPTVRTRRLFTEWKTTLLYAALFISAFGADLLLPVFSLTDPAVNWGYPRMVEGFFHSLSRGQFSSLDTSYSLAHPIVQLVLYLGITNQEFGLFYLLAATIPFLLLQKSGAAVRRWFIGLLLAWGNVTVLMLMVMGLTADRSTVEYQKTYFAATYVILSILAGCGLMLIGAYYARPAAIKSQG
jgi:hypothetical protein